MQPVLKQILAQGEFCAQVANCCRIGSVEQLAGGFCELMHGEQVALAAQASDGAQHF
jgi:hypothetical protein